MIVRFAMICDKCGVRQPEYDGYLCCADCEADVCAKCCAVYDPDPPGHAICKACHAERVRCAGCDRRVLPDDLSPSGHCERCEQRGKDDRRELAAEAMRRP